MNKAVPFFFMISITILIPCLAMESESKKEEEHRFSITPEMIAKNEETFKKFIQELEQKKWPKLQQLPDPDTWFGSITVSTINFVMKTCTRYGELRPKETRRFLGRVFEKTGSSTEERYTMPDILKQGLHTLKEGDSEYLRYINGVLNQLDEGTLQKRDLARLAEAMETEKKKHPTMPGTSNIGNKEEVPDTLFAPFAAAQLFTTCCMEEKLLLSDIDKHARHPHSRSSKRQSREA